MSGRIRFATLAAILVAAAHAAAATAAVRNATLEVKDVSSSTLEVPFRIVGGERRGHVRALIVNRTNARRRLRIRYQPTDPGARYIFVATARTVGLTRTEGLVSQHGLIIPVLAHDVVDLTIFPEARAHDVTPEESDGRLVLLSERLKGARVGGAPLILHLRGVRAEERQVRITPETVTLPVTLWPGDFRSPITDVDVPSIDDVLHGRIHWPRLRWPLTIRDHEVHSATVELRGVGAGAQLPSRATAVLRRADGLSVNARVAIDPGTDNLTTLRLGTLPLKVENAGAYTGTLPLGSGESAPTLAVKLNAKVWWGWAALAVIVGVLLGRMVPPFLKRERLRRRGRRAIKDAIRLYSRRRRGRPQPASYDLDYVISPERWLFRGVFRKPADEPAGLLRDLAEHETLPALRKSVTAAKELRTKVEQWSQVEGSAERLQGALTKAEEAPFVPTREEADAVALATAAAALAAAIKPSNEREEAPQVAADEDAAEGVEPDEAAARHRRRWYLLTLVAALLVASIVVGWPAPIVVAAVIALVYAGIQIRRLLPEDTGNKGGFQPIAAEGNAILQTLRVSESQDLDKRCIEADRGTQVIGLAIENAERQSRLDGRKLRPSDVSVRRDNELQGVWVGYDTKSASQRRANLPAFATTLRRANRRLREIERRCAPTRSKRWQQPVARVVASAWWIAGSTFRRLVAILKRVGRAPFAFVVAVWRAIASAFNGWFAAAEGLSLLLTLSVPVVVYVLAAYTDAWGSTVDVITAFAAGFVGKVALDFGTSLARRPDPADDTTPGPKAKPPPKTKARGKAKAKAGENGSGDPRESVAGEAT